MDTPLHKPMGFLLNHNHKGFNVHSEQAVTARAFVVGASSDLGQPFRPRQNITPENQQHDCIQSMIVYIHRYRGLPLLLK